MPFQSTHSLRSATWPGAACRKAPSGFNPRTPCGVRLFQRFGGSGFTGFNPRTPCGVRRQGHDAPGLIKRFQSTHSLRSATEAMPSRPINVTVSIHALLAECDLSAVVGVSIREPFQSTHSLRSATAPNLIHCYSTKQIILCANLPKKTVIARLLFLSIYLSIFYSQCITPIADLPGNSCELEVGAQAMFNSL